MGSKAPDRPTAEQLAAKPILPPPPSPKRTIGTLRDSFTLDPRPFTLAMQQATKAVREFAKAVKRKGGAS